MVNMTDVLLAMSNIPVDDPIAEIWGRQMQGGYKIIEYTGSLPITINANGDALIDYRIYGTDGGVGEQTDSGEPAGYKLPIAITDKNLLADNISQFSNGYVNTNGGINPPDKTKKEKYSDYVSIVPNTSYTFAMTNGFPGNPSGDVDGKPWRVIAFYKQNKTFINRLPISVNEALNPSPVTATSPNDAFFARVAWRSYGSEECPVLVTNRNVYPVYIGENQLDSVEGVSDYVDKSNGKIVRMIGEYTFTGDESFNKYGSSDVFYTSKTIDPVGITTVNTTTMRCDHPTFTAIENKDTRYWLNPEADDICCFLPGGMSQVFLRSTSNFTTATECKAYLKAQYDNGTPVKISYWLKTPIEEDPPVPLPEIPTIKGETIIDYDGEPKPSQMYVKYKGKG